VRLLLRRLDTTLARLLLVLGSLAVRVVLNDKDLDVLAENAPDLVDDVLNPLGEVGVLRGLSVGKETSFHSSRDLVCSLSVVVEHAVVDEEVAPLAGVDCLFGGAKSVLALS
jgi:hypothetical protein